VTNSAIATARLHNSRLLGPQLESPEAVVEWFGAVQSQDVPGALWAISQRMSPSAEPTLASLGAAMDDGRMLRTHVLRPTWHFVTPDDLRWIQGLTAGRVHQVNGSLYRRLRLGPDEFRRAEAVFRDRLAGGASCTREELADAVRAAGIAVDLSDSLVITHLAMHAELEAVIVNGPRRGKQATYALVDERVPPASTPRGEPRSTGESLRELTVRYFRSHGPALVQDMAWWSGLTTSAVREGIELAGDTLEGRRIDGKEYWAAAGGFDPRPVPEPYVVLLSNYDEAVASYRDYGPALDEALPRARTVADALGAHLVIRDGFVVGGWRRAFGRDEVTITVTLLLPLAKPELDALEAAATAFGRFVGLRPVLRLSEPAGATVR
jgi:hypothetical protein